MTQHALDDLSEFSIHHLRLRLSPKRKEDESALTSEATDSSHSQNPDEALIVRLEADNKISAIYSEPPRHSKVLRIFYPSNQTPSTSSSSSLLSNYLASQLEEVYVEERAILEHVLTSGLPPFGQQAQSSNTASRELRNRQRRLPNPELSGKLATRMDRSLKYAPTYHITISLFTPTAQPSAWDIEAAIADYFAPLLKLLSPVSTFTVETQIQLHAQFAPSVHLPEFDEQQNFWTLREEDISAFINAAEWPLSPSLGAGPTLNFILAASLLLSASSTMGSLANLTVALPSIAIPETVSFAVDITLSHLRQACSDLKAGKFVKALEHARVAEEQAEKGFFEKSMVGQVYFPDEHKVAVYLPLLGPIGVPLVMSALKEVKRIVAVYRERKYGR
ncbi:uncharacterized protein KY384_001921 [Bacidia gigantensis]|uniref:uncharacterized protein n=1 Tax=Bacidia gigantensis TaxID=2732470 RepID=UPI001D0560BD|nr:uncharacterized protein KY384_001921 [Bacidia gigantensis]KAG8533138.1 hypothetical protein KY384_001921 [Bacidia gigantensis]